MKTSIMAARLGSPMQAARAASRLRCTASLVPRRQQQQLRHASDSSGSANLKKTPLYDLHVAHGGKMVPFADHALPVQYTAQSLADSHHFTRNHASLFDVSHMVQHVFRGKDAAAFLERITPSDWQGQKVMEGKLTALLWDKTGGIVDDSVTTRLGEEEFYVVTNGACFEKDSKYLDEELGRFGGDVQWTRYDGSGLVALQGPQSAEILAEALASPVNLKELYFGSSVWAELKLPGGGKSPQVLISRGGYTGEDGFELSIRGGSAPEATTPIVESLLALAGPERLRLAGLGARDSLRLEAGMCLYGHDLDDTTTPVEAGLAWIIPKSRRDPSSATFHGASTIIPQLTPRSKGGAGVSRRRVGLVVQGAPAREGAAIEGSGGGEKVGVVTSGVPSPTMGKNIAMGYVKDGMHKAGTEVDVRVRGKVRKGVVTKMPFVPAKYWKGTAPA